MCFSSGKTAEQYYQEIKPEAQPLPSLGTAKVGMAKKPVYGNVGQKSPISTLLIPMTMKGNV